jgi:hypothetical protein
MGMTFEITETQDILVISIKGEPCVDDIKQILDQIRNASGYTHSARLWDFQASSFTFSQNEVLDIASYASTADKRPAKVAMLVKEDLSFGVSRIYEVFRNTDLTQINVFKDKTEALTWLREPT